MRRNNTNNDNAIWQMLTEKMEADTRYRAGVTQVESALDRFAETLSADPEQSVAQVRAVGGWTALVKRTIDEEMPSFRVGGFAYALESRSYLKRSVSALMLRSKQRYRVAQATTVETHA